MATEVLSIGVNPAGMEAGYRRASRASDAFRRSARSAAGVVDQNDSGLAKLGRTAQLLSPVLAGLGATMSTAFLVNRSVSAWLDLDQAMTRSTAIMGDVDAAMRQTMQDTAKEVARDLNFSASQVAEAYFFLASAGMDAAQSVAAMPAVAAFAKAGMFDLSTATDLATDAQSALGLTSKDAQENLVGLTRVTDALVKANTLANASVEQFASALTNKAAAGLRLLNKDVEEGLAVLAAYADQGTKGAAAGEQLAMVLRDLQRASRGNREVFDALGISVFDAQGGVRGMADIISDLERVLGPMSAEMQGATLEALGFQDRSVAATQALIGTSDAIREYEAEIREAGGTTQEVADRQMESFREQIGRVQRGLEGWAGTMASTVAPALKSALDNVDLLTDAVIALAIAVGITAAVGMWSSVLGIAAAMVGWGSAMAALVFSVRSLSAALALLQLVIGPAGWLVLGVTALTGALFAFRRENRLMVEEAKALEKQLARTADEIGTFSLAAAEASMLQFQDGARNARREVAELESELAAASAKGSSPTGTGGTEQAAAAAKLRLAVKELAELEALSGMAAARWNELLDAASQTSDVVAGIQTPDASGAASQASRERVADLQREYEQEQRLLEAAREGSAVMDTVAGQIDRENAIRQAGLSVREQERAAAEALAAAIWDTTRARAGKIEAWARGERNATMQQELDDLVAMRELTESHTGSVEELAAAQSDLAKAIADRASVEELVADKWDPEAARERVALIRQEQELIAAGEATRQGASATQATMGDLSRQRDDLQGLVELHREFTGAQEELDAAVRSYNNTLEERAAIEQAIAENPLISPEEIDAVRELVRTVMRLRSEVDDLGEAGANAADRLKDGFSAALGAISTGIGGLAGQLASVAQSFMAGGLIGGAGAIGGMALGAIFGDSASAERAAAAQQRYNDALEDFEKMFSSSTSIEDGLRKIEEAFRAAAQAAADTSGVTLKTGVDTDRTAAEWRELAERAAVAKKLQAYFLEMAKLAEQAEANTERLKAQIDQERASAEEDMRVRLLRAQGLDAEADAMRDAMNFERERIELVKQYGVVGAAGLVELVTAIETATAARREELAAIKGAEDARRQMLESRQVEFDLIAREAALRGDDAGAFEARSRARAEAEMAQAQALLDAGRITAEAFARLIAVIGGELGDALRDFADRARAAAQASREAAAAERQRQQAMQDNLQLELLQLTGQAGAAQDLQNRLERDRLIDGGADANTLALLKQVQAERARRDAMQSAAQASERLNASLTTTSRILNAPTGLPTALLRLTSARRLFPAAGGGAGGGAGGSSNTTNRVQSVTYDFGGLTVVAAPGEDGEQLLDRIISAANKRGRDGVSNPLGIFEGGG